MSDDYDDYVINPDSPGAILGEALFQLAFQAAEYVIAVNGDQLADCISTKLLMKQNANTIAAVLIAQQEPGE